MNIIPVLLEPKSTYLVPRANLIFCTCAVCLNEVNWRHVDATYELTGECCCIAHRARPANHKMAMYRVESRPADMKNVHWLHRPMIVEPPPKRHG